MSLLVRTNSTNKDFVSLVKLLDQDLKFRDGEEHLFHAQYNKIDHIHHVVVAYKNQVAVGCGAIKHFDDTTAEVKRMFVSPDCRGEGIATKILNALEHWARELNYEATVLETGVKYPEAIALYQKHGYIPIPRYGQYEQVLSSRCFRKKLD
ncbi:MAG: GNAT family N-acetyltransferase [Flavobacteriales bacterium]|nr:GNAT family N-acetyltransferase [Flavobacteriales bacterium]